MVDAYRSHLLGRDDDVSVSRRCDETAFVDSPSTSERVAALELSRDG